jgi:hypothetical protein
VIVLITNEKKEAGMGTAYAFHALEVLLLPLNGEKIPGIGEFNANEFLQLFRDLEHSKNEYHDGETLLEHTAEVYAEIEAGFHEHLRLVLSVAALLHDTGKVYTRSWDEVRGVYTFHNHWKTSAVIAQAVMDRTTAFNDYEKRTLVDLVRLHDVFHGLWRAREKAQGAPTYLKKFAKEEIVQDIEGFSALVSLALADNHPKIKQEEETRVWILLQEIADYRRMERERQINEAMRDSKISQNFSNLKPVIAVLASQYLDAPKDALWYHQTLSVDAQDWKDLHQYTTKLFSALEAKGFGVGSPPYDKIRKILYRGVS